MPELPEVETIRRDLAAALTGAAVTEVEVRWPGCVEVRAPSPKDVPVAGDGSHSRKAALATLVGRRVAALGRRGKLLTVDLEPAGWEAAFHLRMTGQLWLRPRPDQERERDRHVHLVLRFRDARTETGEGHLYFRDVRRFGRLYLAQAPAELPTPEGPDALDLDSDLAAVLARGLAGRRAPVKALLLDQRLLAGLGNIYADEVLFAAGVHPERPGGAVAAAEVERLARAIRAVLGEALAERGTTFSDYRDASGQPGRYAERLCVYRREGQPCRRCGATVLKVRVGGRPTRFCPSCQAEEGVR